MTLAHAEYLIAKEQIEEYGFPISGEKFSNNPFYNQLISKYPSATFYAIAFKNRLNSKKEYYTILGTSEDSEDRAYILPSRDIAQDTKLGIETRIKNNCVNYENRDFELELIQIIPVTECEINDERDEVNEESED